MVAKSRLRRGFVKEAEEYALEYRQELEIARHAPLSGRELACHLDVNVTGISEHPAIPEEVKLYYSTNGSNEFSACTLPDGTYREIVHNDNHHPHRQNSNIMHELAHIILGHPPKPPLLADSCRNFDATAEKEANQLGFTLLIPKIAALHAYEKFVSLKSAGDFYGVSQSLLKHRIQITDIRRWSQNRARKAAE